MKLHKLCGKRRTELLQTQGAAYGLRHTHHAMVWEKTGKGGCQEKFASRFASAALKPESVSFELAQSRCIVNCDSVGYPRSDRCSSYAIFDSFAANVCVRRLPFDFKSYITEMLKNDLALPG